MPSCDRGQAARIPSINYYPTIKRVYTFKTTRINDPDTVKTGYCHLKWAELGVNGAWPLPLFTRCQFTMRKKDPRI